MFKIIKYNSYLWKYRFK